MDQTVKPSPRLEPLPADRHPEFKDAFEATRKRMGFLPNSMVLHGAHGPRRVARFRTHVEGSDRSGLVVN